MFGRATITLGIGPHSSFRVSFSQCKRDCCESPVSFELLALRMCPILSFLKADTVSGAAAVKKALPHSVTAAPFRAGD